jgi:hypothetical protein
VFSVPISFKIKLNLVKDKIKNYADGNTHRLIVDFYDLQFTKVNIFDKDD